MIAPPSPSRVRLVAFLLAAGAATLLPACRGSARDGARASDRGSEGAGERGTGTDRRAPSTLGRDGEERFFRVDALVADWDAAQQDGDDARAKGLATKIGQEVDGAFALFSSAARGDHGLRGQHLAVKALAFSARPEATTVLVARLGSDDAALVANALIGLKVRADPDTSMGPLVLLLRAWQPEVRRYVPLAFANVLAARQAAGRPLEEAYARDAMTGLVGLVQDRDPFVRLHTAKAMGVLGRPEAVDFLVLLLRDEHGKIRLAAAAALERIGDPRTFPEVVALLESCEAGSKAILVDILASYAERLQGAPLTPAERAAFADSPRAWDRWFAERLGKKPAPKAPPIPGSAGG